MYVCGKGKGKRKRRGEERKGWRREGKWGKEGKGKLDILEVASS